MPHHPFAAPLCASPRRRGPLTAVLLTVILAAGPATLLPPGPAAATEPPVPASRLPAPVSGVWPLQPRPDVVARFDPPASRWGSGHRGVDLAGRVGQPVRVALPGRVGFAGRLAGRGVVVVDHGATRTTYEPVAAVVRVGDEVPAGAVLGRLQLFGSHCFPRVCLHWGWVEGRDRYRDPLMLVGAVPVRLLPLHGGPPGAALGRPGTASALPLRPPPSFRSPGAFGLSVRPLVGPVPAVGRRVDGAAQARGWAWW